MEKKLKSWQGWLLFGGSMVVVFVWPCQKGDLGGFHRCAVDRYYQHGRRGAKQCFHPAGLAGHHCLLAAAVL